MDGEWEPPSHVVTLREVFFFLLCGFCLLLVVLFIAVLILYLRPDFNGQKIDWTQQPVDQLYVTYAKEPMPWFRGNIHSRSTLNGEEIPAKEVVEAYARKGYDFLMLSEHNLPYPQDQYGVSNLIILTGYEIGKDILYMEDRAYHKIEPVSPHAHFRQGDRKSVV
mgnify:CR=1 FL=1